mmetsp:Transcript_18002/g.40302  ORF Transcript_18002/g.40302 Transcript_18002/m.40302 type:complete len:245 (-) Transcript_18002:201-935(-)
MNGADLSGLRVIFLDCDGVLCCNQENIVELPKLLHLQAIVQATRAKVVLSTNWRFYSDLKSHLIRELDSFGIECIGDTPLMSGNGLQPNRPKEILAWLQAWSNSFVRPAVQHWVAVDDRMLLQEMGGEQLEGHFVQTNAEFGITPHVVQQTIDLLLTDQCQSEVESKPTAPSSWIEPESHFPESNLLSACSCLPFIARHKTHTPVSGTWLLMRLRRQWRVLPKFMISTARTFRKLDCRRSRACM